MMYFDAGATTLEKPAAVANAVARAVNTISSPGRGTYRATQLAEETAYHCRSVAARMFGVANAETVIFTHNATHGLNIAIRSLVEVAEGLRPMEPEFENDGDYALCGGCFPLRNAAGKLLGYVLASGLPHECDHQLIADGLAEFLGKEIPSVLA